MTSWRLPASRIRGVSFAACYIYSPRGESVVSQASRELCSRLKSCDPEWLPRYAGCVFEQTIRQGQFPGLFAEDTVLVPVPGSAPSVGKPWAAERLAICLKEIGLARQVRASLVRRSAVRKSALSLAGERPTVQEHFDSFCVVHWGTAPEHIVVVDDVITKGRTLFAAALRLHEAFPHADIRAFALVRTLGRIPNVSHYLEPCQGEVRWTGTDTRRDP